MAKTGAGLTEAEAAAEESSLKKELRRLVGAIIDGEDYTVDTADRALRTLSSLKALKLKRRSVSVALAAANGAATTVVPDEFRCPVSGELMRDPVVLATGQVSFLFMNIALCFCFFRFLCLLLVNFLCL